MAGEVLWSTYNEAAGGWQKTTALKGRTLSVQPDMDKGRWYWTVVWAAVHEKYDNKKGVTIASKPSVTAWGIAASRGEAKEAAIARAERRRPSLKREHESQEEMFDGAK